MHPINKNFFGDDTGKIQVTIANGNTTATAYIVKQTGPYRFVVNDGVDDMTVLLAQTTAEATALVDGVATILATQGNSTFHVNHLSSVTCTTTEGGRFTWKVDGSATGIDEVNLDVRP